MSERELRITVLGYQAQPGLGVQLERFGRLTIRQQQVARHFVAGWSSVETGRDLGISPRTVKNHLSLIYRVLEISSGRELAYLLGWADGAAAGLEAA